MIVTTTISRLVEREIKEFNGDIFLSQLLKSEAAFFPKRIKELLVRHVVVEGTVTSLGHGDHSERERVDDTKESEVDASSRELDRVLICVEGL